MRTTISFDDDGASVTTPAARDESNDAAKALPARAGFGSRLAAALIDGVGVLVAWYLLSLILGTAGALIGFLLVIGYSVYFEGSDSGQTYGKRLLGIRVADARTGKPIGHGRAFGRYLGKCVSSFFFCLGYLWMLWDPEQQTWHDKMVSSVVVTQSATS